MERRQKSETPIDRINYFLEPGYVYFSREPVVVRTVLGSCISVCLWDRKLKYGAINHFIYPHVSDPGKATPRYGNVSTALVIKMMEDAGCRRENIIAQVLGGGYPEGNNEDTSVGRKNIDVAREVLKRKNIRVISEDVGGTMGRKIIFDIGTGQVAVFKVHKLRQTDWMK